MTSCRTLTRQSLKPGSIDRGGDRESVLEELGPLDQTFFSSHSPGTKGLVQGSELFQDGFATAATVETELSGQSRVALHPFVNTINHKYQHQQRACLIVGVVGVYQSSVAGAPTRSLASGQRRCNAAKKTASPTLSLDTGPSSTWPQVRLHVVHRDLVVEGFCNWC